MMLARVCVVAVAGIVVSTTALAAEVRNLDPNPVTLVVKIYGSKPGFQEVVKLEHNESVSTKQGNILFIIGKQRVLTKGKESFSYQNGLLNPLNLEAKHALDVEVERQAKLKQRKGKGKAKMKRKGVKASGSSAVPQLTKTEPAMPAPPPAPSQPAD
jgi:hypothetical protein